MNWVKYVVGAVALYSLSLTAHAESIKLWRLNCGTIELSDMSPFSDTFDYAVKPRHVADSCYLISHNNTWMLWDTGLPLSDLGKDQSGTGIRPRLERPLVEQLAKLNVTPDMISLVALSHYHFDHAGQLSSFPKARLLIGASDMAVIRSQKPDENLDRSQFTHWLSGNAKVTEVEGDFDIFGDGKVVMLKTPGHTPGHHSLLVRLRDRNIILSGDLWHFAASVPINGVPTFNTNRADTLASQDRLNRIIHNLNAELIIGHEAADIEKLLKFPQAAE
jgi:glyoxylase-like metal-dependent hydrolase (beta-lactamase superfamily II)